MVEGWIDEKLEALIELDVILGREASRQRLLVDTGFNGFIAVSQKLVEPVGA